MQEIELPQYLEKVLDHFCESVDMLSDLEKMLDGAATYCLDGIKLGFPGSKEYKIYIIVDYDNGTIDLHCWYGESTVSLERGQGQPYPDTFQDFKGLILKLIKDLQD